MTNHKFNDNIGIRKLSDADRDEYLGPQLSDPKLKDLWDDITERLWESANSDGIIFS